MRSITPLALQLNVTDVNSMNHTGFANNFNSASSNDLTFQDVITNPFYYGSSIIFLFLLLCILSFIFIIKSKKRLLLVKPA